MTSSGLTPFASDRRQPNSPRSSAAAECGRRSDAISSISTAHPIGRRADDPAESVSFLNIDDSLARAASRMLALRTLGVGNRDQGLRALSRWFEKLLKSSEML